MDKSRGAVALQMPYLRVVDLQEESEAHANDTFTNAGACAAAENLCAAAHDMCALHKLLPLCVTHCLQCSSSAWLRHVAEGL
jgi:hypothetical protein